MTDDRAKMVLIRDLTPWAKNPRKNDPAVDAVADSIRRFGFASPILARVEDGRVIAGHTRLKAAIKLGMEAVPVRYLDLDDDAANALALADNKLGELAEWDDAALAEILSGLGDGAKGLGWDDDEIAALLADAEPAPEPEDDAPPVQEDAVSVLGEVYQLGPHRLVCGDCREDRVWQLALGNDQAVAMLTDPPYGMGDSRMRMLRHSDAGYESERAAHEWDRETFNIRLLPVKKYKTLIWGAQFYGDAPQELGLMTWSCWDKMTREMGDVPHGALELCCANFGKMQVWPIKWGPFQAARQKAGHPTAKPLELIRKTVILATKPGEIVIDPFCGSGTTIMACAAESRICRAIELDPRYCDVIRRRWAKYAKENDLEVGDGLE